MAFSNYIIGLLLMALVVLLWVSSSEAIQLIFLNFEYGKPFFLTYTNTTLFLIYLPFYYIKKQIYKQRTNNVREEELQMLETEPKMVLSEKQLLSYSLLFCTIWMVMNYLFNLALSLTSVSSTTSISSSCSLFTYLFSFYFLRESLNKYKIFGVFCTIGGTIIISYGDTSSKQGSSPLTGDILSLISAVFYGLYTTLIKYRLDKYEIDLLKFFGYLGLCNSIFFFPFILIFHYSGYEVFSWPSASIWGFLVLNSLFCIISDLTWAKAILLTSPLISSISLSFTIPVALIADTIIFHHRYAFLYFLGSTFVFFGFILVNYSYNKDQSMTIEPEPNQS